MGKKICFDQIISLGFSCHIAMDLESLLYRDHAYPFDWAITDMRSVNDLIESGFQDLFDARYLSRLPDHHGIVRHQKYRFDFYHDFTSDSEIRDQVYQVREKYNKRIKRFYSAMRPGNRVLFIRYVSNKDYAPEEMDEVHRFISLMSSYLNSFMIILISNNNGGWEKQTGDHILQHLKVTPENRFLNESPLYDEAIMNYFRQNIAYNRYQYVCNLFFKIKKICLGHARRLKK
jgi:hypothetical protein